MASFIENVNIIYSKLGAIEGAPQYAQEAGVYAQQSLSASSSALASSVIAQSSAAQCSQNLSDTIRTKDELLAMKESFGLAVRTESASVMLDSFGRYFVQASLVPYGDVLVATVDDGDNDIDIIDGVVSDRELKRFYFTDESLLGKTIIFKYLGSAINTPLSQYLKDTIDALELLDYKTNIDSYAASIVVDTQSQLESFTVQKKSEMSVYGDGIVTTAQLELDSMKAEVIEAITLQKTDALSVVDSLSGAVESAFATQNNLENIKTLALEALENKSQSVILESQNALSLISIAEQNALDSIQSAGDVLSIEDVIASLGTFNEFDAALS